MRQLSLLQRMCWNAEQNVLGLLCIIDVCTHVHLTFAGSKICVANILS